MSKDQVIVIPDGLSEEKRQELVNKLAAEGIEGVQLITRGEATPEQTEEIKRQEIEHLQDIMDREEQRREELRNMHEFKITAPYVEKPKPKKKSSIKPKPRHNDPEVAKRIRAERMARKKANFERRNRKKK